MPQPKLLSNPWASDGLKNNIPAERDGGLAQEAATYAEGFPSITMTPISVGGKPPSGKDMNGVLYEISAHTVWQNQGGRYRFDQAFCDAVGGYPKGAVLINDTLDTEYISLADANTHNPNSGNNTGKWAIHAGKGLKASTAQAGSTQLSSATDSESEEQAATPKAVKAAYDKAVAAKKAADGAVKTTGNQEIGGDKTLTGLATLKKGAIVADSVGDFNANQYLQIGSNNVNSYFYNKRSGKYLSMRNDGELRYDGKRLLNVDDLAGMIPSGAVMYFAGQTAPAGWLKANGAAVSRALYAALFQSIGTTYGAGDGRTTFNLPDLRGEFIRGWDDGRGIDSRRALGSAQSDAIRNITGKLDSGQNQAEQFFDHIEPTGAFGVEKSWKRWTPDNSGGGDNLPSALTFDASRVVPTAAENRPRNIALLACIKI
ncbi:phage tail protein [Neisseria sp. SLRRB23]|uniref:phage tail protein n=1 Tax=Neisseria sp. SLRRB23 TaxID=3435199 RepID=UPI003D7F5E93